MKKILYLDMDGVLVDFQSGIDQLDEETLRAYPERDEIPGIFALMRPKQGAIEAFQQLAPLFDTYILSTAPWDNRTAWSDKLDWVKEHLGEPAKKCLILTHHKNLNLGDFLVDDRTARGVDRFKGEHIYFGQGQFHGWAEVLEYLLGKA